jgi:putative transposase
VPRNLKRYYGTGHQHFITFSCYHRFPLLARRERRDQFLKALEAIRKKYGMVVAGYVVMPEHVHLLVEEPRKQDLSAALKALKQSVSRRVLRRLRQQAGQGQLSAGPVAGEVRLHHFWQARFHDFNIWSPKKHIEKLRYIHRNPVTRGLVDRPEQWLWSSFRHYAYGESGLVVVNERITMKGSGKDRAGRKKKILDTKTNQDIVRKLLLENPRV